MMTVRYPNLLVFLSGLVISLALFFTGGLTFVVDHLGRLNYPGFLLLGVFYPSALTGGFASIAFVAIGEKNNPLVVAVIGGFGAMLADLLIYRFIKIGIIGELRIFFSERLNFIKFSKMQEFFGLKFFRVPVFLLGLLVIASPLPDELGLLLLAPFGIKIKQSAPLLFVLNAIGIYFLAAIGAAIVQ